VVVLCHYELWWWKSGDEKLARWHQLKPSFDPSFNFQHSSTELFMATLIAAIESPWLSGTHIDGVFPDITNNYAHGEFHAVGSATLDNQVFNSAPCEFSEPIFFPASQRATSQATQDEPG
jgi:hypothetical protein